MYRFWRPQPAQATTRATKHQVAKYVKRLRRSESVHKTRFGTIRPNRAAPLVSQPVRQGNCTTRFPACRPSKLRHPFSACRQDESRRSSSSLPAWRTIPFVFRPVSKEGCTIRFRLRARRVAPLVFCLAGKAFLGARFGKNFPNCEPRPYIRKARPGIMQRPHCELSEKGRFWIAIREIFAIATTYVCTLPSACGGIYLDGRHVASPSPACDMWATSPSLGVRGHPLLVGHFGFPLPRHTVRWHPVAGMPIMNGSKTVPHSPGKGRP